MIALDSIAVSNSDVPNKWKNGSVNFNFRHQFDSTGKEITFDFDYLNYRANKKSQLDNIYYNSNWQLKGSDYLIGNLPTDINVYSAKVDFTLPLKKGIKVETGLKSSFVNPKNTAAYYNIISNKEEVDVNKTNNFNYKENINAAYINLSKEIKKWSLQAGVRMEKTNNNGFQFGNPISKDSSFKNSYLGLFPNAFFNFNASEKNQFSFSYGRRIKRPDYEDMNPFLYYIDNYTYDHGNPFLKPSIANVLSCRTLINK
ncbi:MAG: TonB-dependent receptor family protein [Chitinophagaceae bacterium]|nr:TonB-dependent receptor family protein [Chitinophagaceae bacterium]